jgi:hypothetical protein
MAGTVTLGGTSAGGARPAVNKYVLSWTSDSSGNATYTTPIIRGKLLGVEFVPSGSVAPTDQYDVTLNDEGGVDVLKSQGANLSNSAASYIVPLAYATDGTTVTAVPRMLADALSLSVSNAGNAKAGQVVLYVAD